MLPVTLRNVIAPNDVIAARDRAGLTQQQLADQIGVDVKTLREYERGNRPRLRAGMTALEDFVRDNTPTAPDPGAAQGTLARALAEATDMELIAALSTRLAELRSAMALGKQSPEQPTVGVQYLLDHPDRDQFLQDELNAARTRTGRNGAEQKRYEDQIRIHRREELLRALAALREPRTDWAAG